jgi:hypothetical protein
MNFLAANLWLFGFLTALFTFFAGLIQILFLASSQHSIKVWKFLLIWIGFALTSFATLVCGIAFLIGLIGWILKN